jgi:hypothetical protein
MGMKQKKNIFKKKNSKWPSFSTSPKAEQFPPKFHGLVLGLAQRSFNPQKVSMCGNHKLA